MIVKIDMIELLINKLKYEYLWLWEFVYKMLLLNIIKVN